MINKYLSDISKISIELISFKKEKGKIINSFIFSGKIPNNLYEYKKNFKNKMFLKKKKLDKILKNLEDKLSNSEKKIIENEIFIELEKINFLLEVYDIEANKIDDNYIIEKVDINYDFYNKIFFGVEKTDIIEEYNIINKENINFQLFISKEKLNKLLLKSQEIIGDIKWIFGDFLNMSHSSGILKIPDKEKYSIKEIIVLFFHEMTHLFRYLNQEKNFGFKYTFSNYNTLEEGIAQYNEFFYGNKLIDYGEYIPYYDYCYKIILKDISEEQKQEEIYDILKNKGFSKEKSLNYYYRFYRYSVIGSKNLFLKDLVYTKALINVKKLLGKDDNNYEKIMAGRIGIKELDFFKKNNNIDSKNFFEKMLILIKKEFKL